MNFDSYLNLIFPNGLSLDDALSHVLNVGVYIIGICLYGIFIFHFYRFLAARDMFAFNLSRNEESRFRAVRGLLHFFSYVLKYIVIFPFFAFFWLTVLTLILAFLSKDRSFADVMLIALATVCAIRVTAYYHEDLSRDLSKILPFAVLGIFIIDASFFTTLDSLEVIRDANSHRETIFYSFALLVGLEFVLRIVMGYLMVLITGRRRILERRGSAGESEPAPEEAEEPEVYEAEPQERAGGAGAPPAAAPAD